MTIVPLPTPYNETTHVRLVRIDLEVSPGVVHYKQGHFTCEPEEVPAMPYSEAELPAAWEERAELNTAQIPLGITSLEEVLIAIVTELQAHA